MNLVFIYLPIIYLLTAWKGGEEQIRKGLPPAGPFNIRDLRCCRCGARKHGHKTAAFFEMP